MDMAVRVQQHIVRLDVTVYNALLMDIPHGASQLSYPKPHRLLCERLPGYVESEVAAIHQVYHDVPRDVSQGECDEYATRTGIQCPGNYIASCRGKGGSSVRASAAHE
jgi:hypothetical protein